MAKIETIITDHLDVWSSAIKQRNSQGRGSSKKQELYGIQKLRELILELAVRGLLVPQDPNNEPASVLIEKIAEERKQLVKEKKIKKPRNLLEVAEEEHYFNLPKSWVWVRLANIGYDWGQKVPDKTFTYIDVGSINKERGIIESPNQLEASEAPSRARKIVKKGTVIYSTVRPYLLNIAVIDRQILPEPIASTAFAIIHPFEGISADYVYRYLRSPSFIKYVESCQTGVAYPAINDRQFFTGLIPLPPANEQKRIVEKVDELMALCDQLEERQENNIAAHQQLVEVLLAALTQATDAEAFQQAWTRLAANFKALFTTENSIDQLKQTLLQLAVMGKLVPQDPNDEPASVLLEKIAAEKENLIKEGKLKKQKRPPKIDMKSAPFVVPSSWEWKNLSSLFALVTDGDHQAPPKSSDGIPFLVIGNLNSGEVQFDNCRYVPKNYFENLDWTKKPVKGDLLYTVTGSYGIPIKVTVKEKFCVQRHVAILKSTSSTPIDYLSYLVCSTYALQYAQDVATGIAQKTVPLSSLRTMPIAVPPENEQKRIVEKVDQLFAICDQLKEKIRTAEETQLQLADALTNQAIQ